MRHTEFPPAQSPTGSKAPAPGAMGASWLRALSIRGCRSGDLLGRSRRRLSSVPSCSSCRAAGV
eukprot:scaffold125293_cov14-Tisochrysis_lutea.AAC.1